MFNSGLLKGTTIRMGDGTLKNIEDIVVGDTVQAYDDESEEENYAGGDGFDNSHLRFCPVLSAEVKSISKRTETKLVRATFTKGANVVTGDQDGGPPTQLPAKKWAEEWLAADSHTLTTTLEYPYNIQHTSGSLCATPALHGICYHAGWESYRPDISYEYYSAGPTGSEYSVTMPPLGEGDCVWADAGIPTPESMWAKSRVSTEKDQWVDDWEEPEIHVTDLTEVTGSFEVYVLEDIGEGATVWANGILVAAGKAFSYENPGTFVNALTGSGAEKRALQINKGEEADAEFQDLVLTAHTLLGRTWKATEGDLIEYMNEASGSDWWENYKTSILALNPTQPQGKLPT